MSAHASTAAVGPSRYDWHNVTVGGGGFAPAIVFSRAERGLAYLRTDMGGAYRWEDRAGRWVPLNDSLAEGSYMGVESIAADPVNPDTVYMAAGMYRGGPAAMLRSHDRGAHWQVSPLPVRMGGNEDGRGLGERLAIDPRRRTTLLFGSRHDGLWRSDDGGAHWARDPAFPYGGKGVPTGRRTNAGIAFVLFDATPVTHRVFASVADRGAQALYRSEDSGARWQRVAGGPAGLLPVKADIDADGTLYVAYANGTGPSGITDGAVWSLSPGGEWRDITPDRAASRPPGGYIGISVDRQHPGTLVVATIDRWKPIDTIWRSIDGGRHWRDLGPISRRDTRATPFLNWGKAEADFGHWMTGLAIDPYDPARIAYTTGATVYMTRQGNAARAMMWTPWTRGIEQTAVITLTSPTGGAHLISGFGDLGGFVHDRLDQSPAGMFLNPRHTNTNTLDYAGRAPLVVVRSGNVHANQLTTAGSGWSQDGGHGWKPLRTPDWSDASLEANGRAPVTVSADGQRFYVGAERAWMTADRGAHWNAMQGLPGGLRMVTDKVDPRRAWAIDPDAGRLLRSVDGGVRFAPVAARGVCDLSLTRPRGRESQPALVASPFRSSELYLQCGGRLYRSDDGGDTFRPLPGGFEIKLFGLGKGTTPDSPTLYVAADRAGETRLWRSTDLGGQWQRIDDADHRWGQRFRAISGDPRLFGRVYVATDGRGLLYGDPAR